MRRARPDWTRRDQFLPVEKVFVWIVVPYLLLALALNLWPFSQ